MENKQKQLGDSTGAVAIPGSPQVSPALVRGQRVLVQWDRLGKLPGTFLDYTSGDADEDFRRCMVKMDNGFACHTPGFHPDCVVAA
jgi:hypothetical protein